VSDFDQTIDAMQEPAPGTQPAPPDPFDQAIDRINATGRTQLETAFRTTADVAPDRAAEARRLALKFGAPAQVIERNLEDYQKRAAGEKPIDQITHDSPALATWAKDTNNAAIAQDDLEPLGNLEWILKAVPRAFQQQVDQVAYSQLRYKSLFSTLTQAEHDLMESTKRASTLGGELGAGNSWFRKAITGASQLLAQGVEPIKYTIAGLGEGAVVGAVVAAVAPPAAPITAFGGAMAGAAMGGTYGVIRTTAMQETVQAYDELLEMRDEHGVGVDPQIAKIAALGVGGLNGLIELAGVEKFLETIPGLDKLRGKLSRSAMKEALRSPTIRSAFRQLATEYGGTLTAETATEVAQRAVAIAGEELSKSASATKGVTTLTGTAAMRTPSQVGTELIDEAVGAVQSFALGIAPGPVATFVHDAARAKRASINQSFFKALNEGVAQSKTFERLPEAAQRFVEEATKDGPVGTVYAPIDSWRQYWQSQNLDPAAMAEQVTGNKTAYDQAVASGGDLPIPTARYAVTLAGTEHNGYFADELRLGPDEMNGREQKQFVEQLQAARELVTQAATAEPNAARQGVLERLTAAGVPAETAQRYADIYASAGGESGIFAGGAVTRAGMDPAEFYRQYGLTISREGQAISVPRGTSEQTRAATAAATEKAPGPPQDDITAGVPSAEGQVPATTVEPALPAGAGPAAFAGPERRQAIGIGPAGVERRATADQPIDTTDVHAAVAQMVAENPNIKAEAAALGERARAANRESRARIATANRRADPQTEHFAEQWAATGQVRTVSPAGVEHLVTESQAEPGKFDVQTLEGGAVTATQTVENLPAAAKLLADHKVLDNNQATDQTGAPHAGPESQPRAAARKRGLAAGDSIAPSSPRVVETTSAAGNRSVRQESPAQRAERRAKHFADVFKVVYANARQLDPTVNRKALFAEFEQRLALYDELQSLYRESGHDPKDLLRAIAQRGGLAEKAGGYTGEIADLKSGNKFGSLQGVGGVFRKRETDTRGVPIKGLDADLMTTSLQQEQRFNWITDPNVLLDALDEISRNPPKEDTFPGTAELYADMNIDMMTTWWRDSWRDQNLTDETTIDDGSSDILEPAGAVDTSFNIDEFSQSLFDELEPPTATETLADTLDTGEQQPRLPDVGTVRDQNVPTPQLEAPFSLTSEVAKPAKGKQTTLFQSVYHGTPYRFEKFDLQAIGSGEGAQAYGWGLYFAGSREVAEYYRDKLTEQLGAPANQFTALDTFQNDILPDQVRLDIAKGQQAGGAFEDSRAAIAAYRADYTARLERSALSIQEFNDQAAGVHAHTRQDIALNEARVRDMARNQQILSVLEQLEASGDFTTAAETRGTLYTVEIPEDEHMLDHDKLASQQPPAVQAALRELGLTWLPTHIPTNQAEALNVFEADYVRDIWLEDVGIRESLKEGLHYARNDNMPAFRSWFQLHAGLFMPEGNTDQNGRQIYDQLQSEWMQTNRHSSLKESAKAASLQLLSKGVLGIRYLDGVSRRKGEGNANYVLFDDRHAQITEFGQPLPAALDTATVNAWAQDVQERAGADLVHFDVRLLASTGDLELETIAVNRGAQRAGLGSRVMQELTRFADQHNKRIVVTPAPRGFAPGGGAVTSSRSRLVNFYKRFGFVENKGRQKDFTTQAGMYREPTVIPGREMAQPLFHGSPHDFEKFSLEHVGTGEGAASYGYGLYFAENPVVAAGYHDRLSGEPQVRRMQIGSLVVGQMNDFDYSRNAHVSDYENIRASLAEDLLIHPLDLLAAGEAGFREHVLKTLDQKIADYATEWPEGAIAGKALHAALAKPGALSIKFDPKSGGVYQVDIADRHIEKMLDWDAPIQEQPEAVKDLVRKALQEQGYLAKGENGPRQLVSAFKAFTLERGGMAQGPTGEFAYDTIVQAEVRKQGAALLAEQQALNVKYPGPGIAAIRFGDTPAAQMDLKRFLTIDAELGKIRDTAPKAASARLAAAGVPGLRYLDAGSRDTGQGTRNVVVFDASIVELTHKDGTPITAAERKEYLQGTPGGGPEGQATPRRGAIRFGPSRQFDIALLERADLSTFLHESGHFFLEVFGDLVDKVTAIEPAARTASQTQLLTDWDTLLGSFRDPLTGTTGISSRAAITEAQHEQFARTFEAYLMEGKAPSLELQSTFSRFRAWLIGIYRSLKNLGVEMTPEVRGVMDRLLASDAAIAQAEAQRGIGAMFVTAEMAGMSADEFALYKQTVADASRTAREQLDRKLLSEVQREQTKQWKAMREEIRVEVERAVHGEPVYRALSAIRSGENPDGTPLEEGKELTPLTLSSQAIRNRYGAAHLKRLPRGLTTTEGGLDPDLVADLFGFASGDAMLTALENAPPAKRVIDTTTQRKMLEEHGSILLDGTLMDHAQASVSNEDREMVIRKEMRALGQLRRRVAPFVEQGKRAERAAGAATQAASEKERAYERRWFEAEAKLRVAIATGEQQVIIDQLTDEVNNLRQKARGGAAIIRAGIPPANVLRDAARAAIGDTLIRDVKPERFWSASRRAGQDAIEKAARQDFNGAIVAKQQELIHLQMYREAQAALDDIDARVQAAKDLAKPSRRAAIGQAGSGYLDQIDGLLDRYQFAHVSNKVLERRAELRNWAEALEAQGMPVDLPDELLNEARRKNYQEMTYAELVGVTDGIKQIVHLAQLQGRLLKAVDTRDFNELRDNVIASIRANHSARALPLEFREADVRTRSVSNWFASHRKISDIAQAFDGYVDGGIFWSAFMRPINEAGDAEQLRKGQAGAAYQKILEQAYPGRELATLRTMQHIPAINSSLSKEARLAVALNWGNQEGRDRLTTDATRKWSHDQVVAILDTLDARDWQFVQQTWDYLNTFWPEIAAKMERVTGLPPVKVEALPVQTKFGELKGGYYPLAYDSRLNPRQAQHEEANAAKLQTAAAYIRTTTKRGHEKTRQAFVKSSVRLEIGVAFAHLDQVIHDLTHHETLIDTTRLLRNPLVTKAILETHGDIVFQQLTRGLQDIAMGSTPKANTVLDKSLNYVRTGTQIAGLGWNLWTGLQQPLGLFNGASRVGAPWVLRGLTRWLRDAATMEHTTKWIAEASPMMRARTQTATQDLVDLRAAFRQPGGWFDTLVRTVTADHVTQQTIVDSFLWHIGVAQRVADVPTWLGQYEKSRAAGESEERSARIADQAVLDSQGGGQIKDLAQVQRGGPVARVFLTFYSYGNTVFNATARAAGKTNFRSPTQVATFLGHLTLLYIAPAFATTMLSRMTGRRGGDDDTPDKFVGDWLQETIVTAMNTMILLRELGGLAQDGARGYAGPAGTRIGSLLYNAWRQVEQGELDESLFKAINAAAGILFHYPATQVQRTIDGWVALEEGRTTNPAVLLTGPPPKNQAK
jgi:GNAT superfamily N-acetyltransferase